MSISLLAIQQGFFFSGASAQTFSAQATRVEAAPPAIRAAWGAQGIHGVRLADLNVRLMGPETWALSGLTAGPGPKQNTPSSEGVFISGLPAQSVALAEAPASRATFQAAAAREVPVESALAASRESGLSRAAAVSFSAFRGDDAQSPLRLAARISRLGSLALRAAGGFFDNGRAAPRRDFFAAAAPASELAPGGDEGAPRHSGLSRAERKFWWRVPPSIHGAVTVPLYALRREANDPGIGKFTDLGRYYREVLAPQGVSIVLLLPHYAILAESLYAPVSPYALNEDSVDWAQVADVPGSLHAGLGKGGQHVDHAALRERETAVALKAYRIFRSQELKRNTERARAYVDFVRKNTSWLDEYAEFMALAKQIGKFALDWTPEDVRRAKSAQDFEDVAATHRYAQWNAYLQLQEAVGAIHAAGGRALFSMPMFRTKNGVDAWKRPGYFVDLKTRNPGIKNHWVHEDWKDLALWDWAKLKGEGYKLILDPYRYWLDFGFDGALADALHFAYAFGNGQVSSGNEPGDDYLARLSHVFEERGALALAEAYEGKDADARRFGFVTVGGDWKAFSTHDDLPRKLGFLSWLLRASGERSDGATFLAHTLGDEWADPFPVKEVSGGHSHWRYRIPLPGDPDYRNRVRRDAQAQLRALKSLREGNIWRDLQAVWTVLVQAADTFVQHHNGGVQIWAAAMDWFLEEWGRDTFISLPGLLLETGRLEEAKELLRGFARYEHGGLIPNKIWDASRWSPERPEGVDYNTVDAPLWFIQAVKQYAERSGDWALAQELAPVIRRIIRGYVKGTGYHRYGRFNRISMDSDGLIRSPAQATWMDADPEGQDKPVTPRNGKAVEINALWYSGLRFLARLERRLGEEASAKAYDGLAEWVRASFNARFYFESEDNRRRWGGDGGALRDVVDGDPHEEAIRPNMLFAVSHGEDLLTPKRQRSVVLAATRDLLTPYGLRTLSYRDSHYRARYETWKSPLEKDQAYHQGTAWPWLMGPYLDALARVRQGQGWTEEAIRAETQGLLTPLAEFLASRPEGSIPEVFDGGEPLPALTSFSLDDPAGLARVFAAGFPQQNPGGTRSQAWSVAEMLRALGGVVGGRIVAVHK